MFGEVRLGIELSKGLAGELVDNGRVEFNFA